LSLIAASLFLFSRNPQEIPEQGTHFHDEERKKSFLGSAKVDFFRIRKERLQGSVEKLCHISKSSTFYDFARGWLCFPGIWVGLPYPTYVPTALPALYSHRQGAENSPATPPVADF
jgi:hypothetical protein